MPARCRGFTLAELLIVVLILGIIALAALPGGDTQAPYKLDLAASEIAEAIRFARSEAIRSGKPHGVEVRSWSDRVRVYWLNTSGSFPIPTYDVYHPTDRKLYDIRLADQSPTDGVDITSVAFYFEGSSMPRNLLGFSGGDGIPKTDDFGTIRMLTSAQIQLAYGTDQRTITVAPMTGRVTIQ